MQTISSKLHHLGVTITEDYQRSAPSEGETMVCEYDQALREQHMETEANVRQNVCWRIGGRV